jgi:hypothetical protein
MIEVVPVETVVAADRSSVVVGVERVDDMIEVVPVETVVAVDRSSLVWNHHSLEKVTNHDFVNDLEYGLVNVHESLI